MCAVVCPEHTHSTQRERARHLGRAAAAAAVPSARAMASPLTAVSMHPRKVARTSGTLEIFGSSSAGASSSSSSLSVDHILTNLEDAATALFESMEGRTLTSQQAERVSHVNGRIYSVLSDFRSARRRESERLTEEVLLPADMLAHAIGFCSPTELAIASQVCRHFKVVVAHVIQSRIIQIGIELPKWQKPDSELLSRLESEMKRAPALLPHLHQTKKRAKFKNFHDSVICYHRDALLEKLQEPHNNVLRRVDLTFDILQMLYGPQLPSLWLKQHADAFFRFLSDRNHHIRGTAVNIVCDERFPRDAVIARQEQFVPILDKPMHDDFSSRRFEVLTMLRRLPVASLGPAIRAQVEKVSKETPCNDQDVRRLARELMIGFSYSGATNRQ